MTSGWWFDVAFPEADRQRESDIHEVGERAANALRNEADRPEGRIRDRCRDARMRAETPAGLGWAVGMGRR